MSTGAHDNIVMKVEGLKKVFQKAKKECFIALDNINFSVYEGEFLSIVGPSGCGKTTILRVLAGLETPTEGIIYFEGRSFRSALPKAERKKLGFVFQQPNLLEWRSLRKNIEFPLEVLDLNKNQECSSRVAELLKLVGLHKFSEAFPHELSGGMQQRAGIARSLVHDPSLLLMDEPFGALDAITREQLNFELLSIWQQKKKTIVFITHNIGEAVLLSQRILVMSPAHIIDEVQIDIPYPRTKETLRSDSFFDHTESIVKSIGEYYDI